MGDATVYGLRTIGSGLGIGRWGWRPVLRLVDAGVEADTGGYVAKTSEVVKSRWDLVRKGGGGGGGWWMQGWRLAMRLVDAGVEARAGRICHRTIWRGGGGIQSGEFLQVLEASNLGRRRRGWRPMSRLVDVEGPEN
jgi:hypothetical protein